MQHKIPLGILAAGMLLQAALAVGNAGVQPAMAQAGFDDGASSLAPGQIIGPDAPGLTDEFAPGKIIGPDTPGKDALEAGIIGPDTKEIP